jgi:hypothetical protein
MKAYPQAIVTNRIHQLRVPWALVVFIALLFFLHSHDFFRAIHFEEAGYGMAEEVAAAIQRGSPLRRVALLLLGGFGAVTDKWTSWLFDYILLIMGSIKHRLGR